VICDDHTPSGKVGNHNREYSKLATIMIKGLERMLIFFFSTRDTGLAVDQELIPIVQLLCLPLHFPFQRKQTVLSFWIMPPKPIRETAVETELTLSKLFDG
jgi:hypothetical protein